MATKKKKPFWAKFLSAVLVVSMLIGNAGMSSFAASDSPDEKITVEEAVSEKTVEGEEITVETPGTDIVETQEPPTQEAGAPDMEEDLQTSEGAGTSDVEEEPEVTEGNILPGTDDDSTKPDAADAENGEVISGASDADTEETDAVAPSDSETNTDQATEDSMEAPAELKTEKTYAALEEFLAAVAAVGEVDEAEDLLMAIDICLEMYGRLSPEDKEAQSEAYAYIAGCREQVAAGNSDEGIEELVYTTYTSHITLYPSGAAPTGTKLKVGDCINGHWYVESISTSSVKFGSPYGEHNNSFQIPAPSTIWEGVTHSYDTVCSGSAFFNKPSVGANGHIIYTGGIATYSNLKSTGTGGGDSSNKLSFTVIHQYYTNGGYDGQVSETFEMAPLGYNGSVYASNSIPKKTGYNGNTYTFSSASPGSIYVSKGATGNRGTFTLRYDRTMRQETYTYNLTWNYNGGKVENYNGSSKTKTETSGSSTHIFYEDADGYGSPRPIRDGYTFKGWTYSGNGNYTVSTGQINMTGIADSTVSGTLTAVWEQNAPVIPDRTFRLVKEFKGLNDVPEDFTISYNLVCADTTNGTLTSSGTLTGQNGTVDEDAMTVTWQVPYFYGQKLAGNPDNNATNVLTITEDCDVEGYTYESGVRGAYMTKNADGTITCIVSSMASGVTRTITNTYSKTAPPVDDNNGVSITKTRFSINDDPNKTTAEKGDTIVWNIRVTNNSNVRKTVKLTEQLAGATLSKSEVTLEPGKSETVTATYTVTGDEELKEGKLYNTVSGTTGGEGERENPEDTDDGTEIDNNDEKAAKLEVIKTVDNASPKAGETVIYTIEVENTGDADATGVTVKDPLNEKLEFVSWELNGVESGEKPANDVYMIGDLAAGASATLTIKATVKEGTEEGTEIVNVATGDYEGKPEGEEPRGEVTIKVEGNGTEPTPTPEPEPMPTPEPTPTPAPEPTPTPEPEPTPTPAPEPTPTPEPEPTPTPDSTPTPPVPEPTTIIPEPVPAVGPAEVAATVTPVVPAQTEPAQTAALAGPTPEVTELMDEEVPLAAGEKETITGTEELGEEAVPLAAGKGGAWALINFALMNLAVFESLMLLIGYFIKTKGSSEEEDDEEKKKLKKKGIMRIISLLVAVISVIAFILTEDITLPTAFVDRYTILMAIIAIVQTVVVWLSRKEVKDEEQEVRA